MSEKPIPQLDLAAQHESIRPELEAAVGRVLDSGQFVLGDEVAAFEQEFAGFCGTKHAVAVNSGTSALHLALLAAGIGPGDEVLTVPFTFVATAAAILYVGASPVFVDIDPTTFNIDPAAVTAAITGRTKAIIPVHLYGLPADMEPLVSQAREHGLTIIEDAAQAHGAEYHSRRVGGIGDLGCFSFYPTKNLGACGEGGIIVTDDADKAHRMRILRDWGQEEKGLHSLRGFNYRMEGIQGAVLRVKLAHLEEWNERRRRHAAAYRDRLAGSEFVLPVETPGTRHVYHQFTIRTDRRDEVRSALSGRRISTGIHYPIPVHLQPAYSGLGFAGGSFPRAERVAREVLSIPVYPELTDPDRERVCLALEQS